MSVPVTVILSLQFVLINWNRIVTSNHASSLREVDIVKARTVELKCCLSPRKACHQPNLLSVPSGGFCGQQETCTVTQSGWAPLSQTRGHACKNAVSMCQGLEFQDSGLTEAQLAGKVHLSVSV